MEFPQPEVGLVISYSYLWSDEAEAGHVEGRKNRPCAIVLVVQQTEGNAPAVTVVPITHSPHRNPEAAIEIPPAIKRHLGLDLVSRNRIATVVRVRCVAVTRAVIHDPGYVLGGDTERFCRIEDRLTACAELDHLQPIPESDP